MKLYLLFLIIVQSISYCQGDFLVNFYSRDFKVTKQEIKSLFLNDPVVRVTKDSANLFFMRGVKWRDIKTNKVDICFVEDTIANFFMGIKDTTNIKKTFESILSFMKMQFGPFQITNTNDNYYIENRMWLEDNTNDPGFVLQLTIIKEKPDYLYIAYTNMRRFDKLYEKK